MIDSKIILHNYILYKGQPSYTGIFPVYLGMSPIYTDFQQCTWLGFTFCWNIRVILGYSAKMSKILKFCHKVVTRWIYMALVHL